MEVFLKGLQSHLVRYGAPANAVVAASGAEIAVWRYPCAIMHWHGVRERASPGISGPRPGGFLRERLRVPGKRQEHDSGTDHIYEIKDFHILNE